jgi:hypothetical protein
LKKAQEKKEKKEKKEKEKGPFVCSRSDLDCRKEYARKNDRNKHEVEEHGPHTLFVYHRHHLVFKTDIVISVNAH